MKSACLIFLEVERECMDMLFTSAMMICENIEMATTT